MPADKGVVDGATEEPVPVGELGSPAPDAALASPVRPSLARNTAIFAAATGIGRVAGLAREIVAARYFGVTGPMSAFTLAFQVPNLIRALFADAALPAAFVPVFTELLAKGRRREAIQVASSFVSLIVAALGSLLVLLVVGAPLVMKVFAPGFQDDPALEALTVELTRIMFPTVLVLALTGLVAGMLNALDHFAAPAIAPALYNLVIVGALVGVTPLLSEESKIYAYALGVVAATVVQFALPLPWLRKAGVRLELRFDWRNPYLVRILKHMLPVTISVGLFNFALLVDSTIGTLSSEEAAAAIDKAFKVCVLPQGIFSLAVTTVLFPTMSRLASQRNWDELRERLGDGVRQICLLMIPSAVVLAVLAEPVTRLIYERGAFDADATRLVGDAMVLWALVLPFQGVGTLLAQAFFGLQRPWLGAGVAAIYLCINAGIALALYRPLGIQGIVLGTVCANVVMVGTQWALLRGPLGGLDGRRTLSSVLRMLVAGAALAGTARLCWMLLDDLLADGLLGQVLALGGAVLAGVAVYGVAVTLLRVPAAAQLGRAARALAGRGD